MISPQHNILKIAVFDLDGTVWGSLPLVLETWRQTIASLKPSLPDLPLPSEAAIRAGAGMNTSQAVKHVYADLHLPAATLAAISTTFNDLFIAASAGHVPPLFPAMDIFLSTLTAHGWHCATATGLPTQAMVDAIVAHHKLESIFPPDRRSCAGNVANGKPAPDMIFRNLQAILATQAPAPVAIELVMVGDAPVDILTLENALQVWPQNLPPVAAARAIGVTYGFRPQAVAEHCALKRHPAITYYLAHQVADIATAFGLAPLPLAKQPACA